VLRSLAPLISPKPSSPACPSTASCASSVAPHYSNPAAKLLGARIQPPAGLHPWPERIKSTILDRFNPGQEETLLTLIQSIVVEVSADTAWSGQSFRHALRFLRFRPELHPADIRHGVAGNAGKPIFPVLSSRALSASRGFPAIMTVLHMYSP